MALRFARELERLAIPYLLGGSLASATHGEPRATLDADFAVHMTASQAAQLASALETDFYVDREALVEAATLKRPANVMHKRPFVKVDVHVRHAEGHSREEMQRAVRVLVGASAQDVLRISTAEDTVLQKLHWYRMGEEVSDRQWRDILGVLKRNGRKLDHAYMQRWARELGVLDLLERAIAQATFE
ncbi:MAG: hypothetical protein JNL28_04665 [Planctomycetes bacterium]|nr:hypothetical protein [Planctomycetota bacterium]